MMAKAAEPERLDIILGNVRVPASLVAESEQFGGRRDRDCLRGNLVIRNGMVVGLTDDDADVELGGMLVTTPLVESHCHLDKCYTAERMAFRGGPLSDAICAQAEDKRNWTHDDVRGRATRGLEELWRAGVRIARTHVDWDIEADDPDRVPLAWRAIGELCEEWRGRIMLQRSALISIDAMADAAYADRVASVIASTGGVLGAFVFDQPNRRDGIRNMIRAATRHGLALDFHVDEGLSPGLDGMEIIAREVIETGYSGQVLCGHACNLGLLEPDVRRRRIDLIAQAGLSVVSLPSSNLYLQDRGAEMPRLRGLTDIKELLDANVNIAFGTDNVQDAFCPLGTHDPAATLAMGVLATQLEPPLGSWLPMIAGNAATALGYRQSSIDRCPAVSLLVWDVDNVSSLIGGGPARWQSAIVDRRS